MEEMEEGIIQDLLTDYEEWIYEKFNDIRKSSEAEGDDERVPAHAWNNEFFELLAGKFGVLLGVDEDTRKMTSMEVARLRIRTKSYDVFNMGVEAYINDFRCDIKVAEEWCGPLYWISQPNARENEEETLASDEDSEPDEDDGLPLFTAEDGGYDSPVDEEEDEKSPKFKKDPIIGENYEDQPIIHRTYDNMEKEKRRSIMRSNDNDVEEEIERGEHGEVNSQTPIGGEENVGVKSREGQQLVEVEASQTGENIDSGGDHKEIVVVEDISGCNSKPRGCEEERCNGRIGGAKMVQAQTMSKRRPN